MRGIGTLIAAACLMSSPALAAHNAHHAVSCKQIKSALDSGKSADDVARDLKVSAARVKSCTAPAAKHGKKGTAHPS